MNFSFFYAPGTAGYVRGEQMAEVLGGKKNPKNGFENDVCIYVKVIPPEDHPKHSYADVDDSTKLAKWLETHKDTGVIATSENTKTYLSKTLNRSDIVVIPHAHCNYERWVRPDREVRTVGVIGSKTSFQGDTDKFSERLKEVGLEFVYEKKYWDTYKNNRLKVCDFHKQVDIQVCWRPKMFAKEFKNPNKLVNAGSFGIPTIAYSEEGFNGWGGKFIEVNSIDEMVEVCKELKENKTLYMDYSKAVVEKAESNHLDNIIELYRNL